MVPPWPALESEAVCLLNSLLELDWLAGSGEQLQGGVNHRYLRLVVTMELLRKVITLDGALFVQIGDIYWLYAYK